MKLIKFCVVLFTVMLAVGCSETNNYVHVGPNWEALSKMDEEKASFDINVKVRKKYMLGDEINLTVTSPKDGKLWIVYVDPDDKVNLMYPNTINTNNDIQANKTLAIPGTADYVIEAVEPTGKSMIAFIVTTGDGELADVFSQAEGDGITKALQLVRADAGWAMSKHVVDVTAN